MSGDGFKFRWQRAFMDSTLPPGSRHVLHALGAFMADDGMTAADVASALDMSEQDLEEVYRAGLARDPDIVCCSPRLAPTGEWISRTASDAREAARKAREAAQKAATPTQRTPATDPWAWCEDAPESPQAAPEPEPEPPPPPKASAPTPADVEEAMRHVEAAGPRAKKSETLKSERPPLSKTVAFHPNHFVFDLFRQQAVRSKTSN